MRCTDYKPFELCILGFVILIWTKSLSFYWVYNWGDISANNLLFTKQVLLWILALIYQLQKIFNSYT